MSKFIKEIDPVPAFRDSVFTDAHGDEFELITSENSGFLIIGSNKECLPRHRISMTSAHAREMAEFINKWADYIDNIYS